MRAQARWRAGLARCGNGTALWLAAAAVLAAVTLVAFTHLRQFETVATPWPFDPGFATIADGTAPLHGPGEPPAGWQVEGDRSGLSVADGVLRLRNDDPEAGVGVRQLWRLAPDGPHAFKLSATVASEGIEGTRNGFRVGEVSVVADADIERSFFHPLHRLAGLRGTREPAVYVEYFKFPSAAKEVELAIRLRHATGELRVSHLQLVGLGERPWFAEMRRALQVAWALMLVAGLWLFGRGIDHRGSAVALALAAGAGAVLLMMPEGMRDSTLVRLADYLPRRLAAVDALAYLGHFVIFAVAGCLLRLSRRGDPWLVQILLLVGLAGLSEVLQFLAELRTPTLDDWATNAAGGVLGWLPAMGWLWWRQEGQFATQRRSSTTVPPQPAKQRL
jgi:VanZ family protein